MLPAQSSIALACDYGLGNRTTIDERSALKALWQAGVRPLIIAAHTADCN